MTTIERGYLVTMHYDIKMEDGSEVGSTRDHEPLTFIPGLMETDPPELGERIACLVNRSTLQVNRAETQRGIR